MTPKSQKNPHILIVEARFYDAISDALLAGATASLDKAGARYDIITVPGALEIPGAIALADKSLKHYDGFVALGCVIRGETYHFEIVAHQSCRAIMDLTMRQRLAIGNGILTVENEDQAWARARCDDRNKAGFAAQATLRMIELKKHFGADD